MPGSFFGTGAVTSVAGRSGVITLVPVDVGLGNVSNAAQVLRTEMGAVNGVATLGSDGKLPSAQLPTIAVSEFLGEVSDEAAMLALDGSQGSWCSRTDRGTIWVLIGDDPTDVDDWNELSYPTAPVLSVAGKTGSISLVFSDLGGNISPTQWNSGIGASATTFPRGDGVWAIPQSDIANALLWTTKGDIAVATGNAAASRLAVGANGAVLLSDSTAATGLKWGPLPITSIENYATSTLSLTDPNADRFAFWDDSAGHFDWLTPGTTFKITGTTLGVPSSTDRGVTKDVHIAVRTDSVDGTGTEQDPYDGGTQAKLSALMADTTGGAGGGAKVPANANIYFKAGTFFPYRIVCRDGWKIHLTPQTTFQLHVVTALEAAALPASRVFGFFESGATYNQDLLFDGGIWDMNMQNQTQALCPSAIQVVCDGFVSRRRKVINFANTSPTNNECFVDGVFSNGTRDSHIHTKGVLWDENEYTALASGVTNTGTVTILNSNGGQNIPEPYVGAFGTGWFEGVTIRNNDFHDISSGDNISLICINLGGWAKGVLAHGNKFKKVYRSAGSNLVGVGYYCDTGSLINVTIFGDQFTKVFSPIQTESSAGWVRSNIKIFNEVATEIDYIGMRFNETSGTGSDITIDNCNLSGTTSSDGGIEIYNVTDFKARHNIIAKASEQIHIGTGTTVADRFHNCKPDGTAVDGESGALAIDAAVVHIAGTESITGAKTFTSSVQLGSTGSGGSTASPLALNLGATFSNSAGAHLKLVLFDNTTDQYGLGVSSNELDYVVPADKNHVFYAGGSALAILRGSGGLSIGSNTDAGAGNLLLNGLTASRYVKTDSSKILVSAATIPISDLASGTLTDGVNVAAGTSTGSKIGTATGQKLGFWNATPVAQQVLATGAAHTVDEVITMLQTLGLCKQS